MVDWELVKKLIETVKQEEITGLAIEEKGVKYEVRREGGQIVSNYVPAPAASQTTATHLAKPEEADDQDLTAIISPMVGTYYAAASPEAPPFVEAGAKVEPGKVVCIIEAMKLFNEIEAEVQGEVVKVLVKNGQPVEYGQKLMLIKKV